MHEKINGHLSELIRVVKENPELRRILDEDPKAKIRPLLRDHIPDHIKNPAFLVGWDFVSLIEETARIVEKNQYDLGKIRRRIEEHLRKYAKEPLIIGLALFFGIPLK